MKNLLPFTAFLVSLSLTSAIASPPEHAKPEIIADPKTNTVRILIDGKEIVHIDAAGLHVTGNVTYTGTVADVGTSEAEPRK
jgi:hypothetical protein